MPCRLASCSLAKVGPKSCHSGCFRYVSARFCISSEICRFEGFPRNAWITTPSPCLAIRASSFRTHRSVTPIFSAAFRCRSKMRSSRLSQFSLSSSSCPISNRSIPSALRLSRGTFYFAQLGTSHFAATSIEKLPHGQIMHLFADRKGRIWVGTAGDLYRSNSAPHPGANGFGRLSGTEGLPRARVHDIFESREGDVWVGMFGCLAQFPADGALVRVWTKDNGLYSRGALSLGQDRDGNLWMGTDDLGAFKLTGGILSYSTQDGIGMDTVISVAETLRGELYISGRKESAFGISIGFRSGNGFHAIAPRIPKRVKFFGWRRARVILQDHTGEWWLASDQGLFRYPHLERPSQLAQTAPKAVYTARDGLPSDVLIRLYEDRGGNIW